MKPKVTVGVCVRNCERFIGEAIKSIMNQDFPHCKIQVIFVDSSEDDTLSIIQDHVRKMDMSTVVLHTSWRGIGNARNLVIAKAKGDYVLWVDGDMIISNDFLRRLVEFMDENPKAGIVRGRHTLSRAANILGTLEGFSRAVGEMVDYQAWKNRFKAVGTGGALYRMEAVRQVGRFDDNLRYYNEDWDFELRLRKAGWLVHSVDVTCYDSERKGLTWSSLWHGYWLRGYHTNYFDHKNEGVIKHYRMFPPAAFIYGLLHSFTLFRLTQQKAAFLLPVQFTFKMVAWYVGFLRSHLNSRGKSLLRAYGQHLNHTTETGEERSVKAIEA